MTSIVLFSFGPRGVRAKQNRLDGLGSSGADKSIRNEGVR
jgi:hypothetical protein